MKRLSIVSMSAVLMLSGMMFAACSDDDDDNKTKPEEQPTMAQQYQGTYSGVDSINVGMGRVQWDYATAQSVSYTITANSDGTINVSLPDESYLNTQIGDMNIGKYEIDSLRYDSVSNSFTRAYADISTKVSFSSTGGAYGQMQIPAINGEFAFAQNPVITVSKSSDGSINIRNAYGLGRSPVQITNTFKGAKQ